MTFFYRFTVILCAWLLLGGIALAQGDILISCDPWIKVECSGFKVVLNGEDRGETIYNGMLIQGLAPGRYKLEITKDDFKPIVQTVLVQDLRTSEVVIKPDPQPPPLVQKDWSSQTDTQLVQETGTLILRSVPPGAKIVMDGKEIGTTDQIIENVPAGQHEIGFRLYSGPVQFNELFQETAEGYPVKYDLNANHTLSLIAHFVEKRIDVSDEKPTPPEKEKPAKPEKKKPEEETHFTNRWGMRFVRINPGVFKMGSPADEPGRDDDETRHSVRLTRMFFMQTTEVTQSQWRRIMHSAPSRFTGCDNCPVENVTWHEVQEFILRLNQRDPGSPYRLPTEAEWEYACRSGEKGRFCFGDDESLLVEYAWFDTNSGQRPRPVGLLRPNAAGLFDMMGNVREWCLDGQSAYPSDAVTDPRPSKGQVPAVSVCRGGGYNSPPRELRCADRVFFAPDFKYANLGFRLMRTRFP